MCAGLYSSDRRRGLREGPTETSEGHEDMQVGMPSTPCTCRSNSPGPGGFAGVRWPWYRDSCNLRRQCVVQTLPVTKGVDNQTSLLKPATSADALRLLLNTEVIPEILVPLKDVACACRSAGTWASSLGASIQGGQRLSLGLRRVGRPCVPLPAHSSSQSTPDEGS